MDCIRTDSNLRFIERFCTLIGIWTVSASNEARYRIWTGFCIVYNILYVLALWLEQIISLNVNDLYLNLSEVTMFTKMLNILNNRKRIVGLLHRMHHEEIFQVDPANEEEAAIVVKQMGHFSKFANFYFRMTTITVCIGTFNGFGSTPREMAFHAWYPFGMNDVSVPWKFWAVFFYQTLVIAHALINVCWDNLFMYLVTNVQLQFELLNHRLVQGFQEVTADNEQKLKKMFHNFSAIMSLNDEIQDVFETTMFLQFNLSTVILCTTVILLIDVSPFNRPEIFIQLTLYFIVMTTQILMPCLFANEITLEFYKILNAIYSTSWPSMTIGDRKLLISFGERLKRPATINALHFFDINLPTFMAVINTSYSLFAILKNAD